MTPIRIRALRHSAFYSPLLMTIVGGFLEQEGLRASYDVATPDDTVEQGLESGQVQVAQSAVAVSFIGPDSRRAESNLRHFAQINQRDGFFLTQRDGNAGFDWSDLVGKTVLVDHFFQPMAMFRFALHRLGIDYDQLDVIDAGDVSAIDAAFRAGKGEFAHQQGPYAQQLEADGLGQVVASVGEVVGPVAFSSLFASLDWLQTDMARAFMRAYRKGREASRTLPANEIARLEKQYFPDIDDAVLVRTVQAYQNLGCWDGEPDISREIFENTLDVFEFSGDIDSRIAWDEVACEPPDRHM
jgi:NitT/TauT family transport system substrate-binding protein